MTGGSASAARAVTSPAPAPDAVAARRALTAPPRFATLAEVGLDGPFVSPYQIVCGNPAGPVLISYNFLDAPTARDHAALLSRQGYLPEMLFNRVLDRALGALDVARAALYLTHACHLLPPSRSHPVPRGLIDESMDRVTRHEIRGRPVVALGIAAAAACARFAIPHAAVPHPSARGRTAEAKARALAAALAPLLRYRTAA